MEIVTPRDFQLAEWKREDWDYGDGGHFTKSGQPSWRRGGFVIDYVTYQKGGVYTAISDFEAQDAMHHQVWRGFGHLQGSRLIASVTEICLPTWLVITIAMLPMAITIIHRVCPGKYQVGHCPRCGYDLRATPTRCPECGTVPITK